jgi:uncharacterized protein YpuA (DUF1002 family)
MEMSDVRTHPRRVLSKARMAALTGMLPSISSSNWKKIAEHSYEVADAMLEARKEKK